MRNIIRCFKALVLRNKEKKIDCYVIEHPKCGRTWLRFMIYKAFLLHFNLQCKDIDDLQYESNIPQLSYTHNGAELRKNGNTLHYRALSRDKSEYVASKIIFLIRDPRDVLVSFYFQTTKRRNFFDGTISDFIRSEFFGIKKLLTFYAIWYEAYVKKTADDFLLVRYEEMHTNAEMVLEQVLQFLGVPVSGNIISEAVQYASFENMQQMEKNSIHKKTRILQPLDSSDLESYKIRKGKIGGYVDYLHEQDIEYINEQMCQFRSEFIEPYVVSV